MLACHAGGRGFESRPLRQSLKSPWCKPGAFFLVFLPTDGSVVLQRPEQMACIRARASWLSRRRCGSGRGSVCDCREREGPAAAGWPLAQMSPGLAASSFILPRSLPAATGLGLRTAPERGISGSRWWVGCWAPCPWRRNKGGGGGRRPTPGDIRRKGHGAQCPIHQQPRPAWSTRASAPHAAGRRNSSVCRGSVNRVVASYPCRDRCEGDIRRPAAVAMAAPRLPAMVLEPRRKRVTLPGSPLRP